MIGDWSLLTVTERWPTKKKRASAPYSGNRPERRRGPVGRRRGPPRVGLRERLQRWVGLAQGAGRAEEQGQRREEGSTHRDLPEYAWRVAAGCTMAGRLVQCGTRGLAAGG